jgi:hypothetical protein
MKEKLEKWALPDDLLDDFKFLLQSKQTEEET